MEQSYHILLSVIFFLLSCQQKQDSYLPDVESGMDKQTRISTISPEPVDTLTIQQKLKFADSLWKFDPGNAKMIFLDAARSSMHMDYQIGIVKALYRLGVNYSDQSFDSTLYYLKSALPYARKLPPDQCIREYIYAAIGSHYYNNVQFDSALLYVYKGLEELRQHEIKAYKNAFYVYKTAVVIWVNRDNLNTAMPYVEKAEQMAVLSKDSAILTEMHNIKATLYYKRKLLDSAILFYSLVIQNQNAPLGERMIANYNMGTMYARVSSKNDPEKGIPYLEEALRLYRELYEPGSAQEIKYLFGLGVA